MHFYSVRSDLQNHLKEIFNLVGTVREIRHLQTLDPHNLSVAFVTRHTDLSLWQKAQNRLRKDLWGFDFRNFSIRRHFSDLLRHACQLLTGVRSESDPKSD